MSQSQQALKNYREQYCRAELLWSGGSGALTAYERCLFEVGALRLQELKEEFFCYQAILTYDKFPYHKRTDRLVPKP